MRGGGIANLIHRFDSGIYGRLVANGVVRSKQVVVNGARAAHNGDAMLFGQEFGTGKGTVSADDHEAFNAMGAQVGCGFGAALGSPELLASGGLQEGAAAVNDVSDIVTRQGNAVVFHEAFIATVKARNLDVV